jgi:hypothetical protein
LYGCHDTPDGLSLALFGSFGLPDPVGHPLAHTRQIVRESPQSKPHHLPFRLNGVNDKTSS